jgi:hypothetical protein
MRAARQAATSLFRMVSSRPMKSEPEAAYGTPRKPTGLFSSLTKEQQRAVLSYSGPQDHGDETFRRAKA